MISGAVTTSDCLAELALRSAGWCRQCGWLVDKPGRWQEVRPVCLGCEAPLASGGILEIADPLIPTILATLEGARIRLQRKQSVRAALEGNFARAGRLIS